LADVSGSIGLTAFHDAGTTATVVVFASASRGTKGSVFALGVFLAALASQAACAERVADDELMLDREGLCTDHCENIQPCDPPQFGETVDSCVDNCLENGVWDPPCGELLATRLECYADMTCEELHGPGGPCEPSNQAYTSCRSEFLREHENDE
jgi:hypothetical protein